MFTAEVTEPVFCVATAQPFLLCKRCCDFSPSVSDELTAILPVAGAKADDFAVEIATAVLPGGVS